MIPRTYLADRLRFLWKAQDILAKYGIKIENSNEPAKEQIRQVIGITMDHLRGAEQFITARENMLQPRTIAARLDQSWDSIYSRMVEDWGDESDRERLDAETIKVRGSARSSQ
jgi:hypothetical protein